jgi:quinol-cytochrome oxidoreductase complex cytochrome b subunit
MATTHPEHEKDSIPFYPDHVKTEFYVTVGILVLAAAIGVWGLLSPVGLQAPADPLNTPLHVKPEWYFLALYQLLKYIPPKVLGIDGTVIGVMAPVLGVLLVLLWPFFDKKQDSRKAMRLRAWAVGIGVVVLIALTLWGELS